MHVLIESCQHVSTGPGGLSHACQGESLGAELEVWQWQGQPGKSSNLKGHKALGSGCLPTIRTQHQMEVAVLGVYRK